LKPVVSTTRSPRRVVAAGVVAATLTVGAAGAAYSLAHRSPPQEVALTPAAAEEAETAEAPEPLADTRTTAPVTSLTQEQSDAFWAAGYYMEDADALATLWSTDLLQAKSRAGQLLLDGKPVPVAPGSSLDLSDPATIESLDLGAFWDAGYTAEDGATLAALWHVDVTEAKISGGHLVRAGQALPIPPSGTPAG